MTIAGPIHQKTDISNAPREENYPAPTLLHAWAETIFGVKSITTGPKWLITATY